MVSSGITNFLTAWPAALKKVPQDEAGQKRMGNDNSLSVNRCHLVMDYIISLEVRQELRVFFENNFFFLTIMKNYLQCKYRQ